MEILTNEKENTEKTQVRHFSFKSFLKSARINVHEWLKKVNFNRVNNIATAIGIAAMIAFLVRCYFLGILTDEEAMREYFARYPVWGPVIFILIQIVQVIIPVIPGGVSSVAGVAIFGNVLGFIYNYVGIGIGSVLVFLLAKKYGRGLMHRMFKEKTIKKYDSWTETNHRFTKLFAFAIAFPCSPDDFLCYLAGTTSMSLKTFILIMIFCKPWSIIVYSMGLNEIIKLALNHFFK